jgi:hypothetical protein
MRRLPSHLAGHQPVEHFSEETDGFSARKTCVTKRLSEKISDEPGGHQWVVFRRVSKYVWVLGNRPQSVEYKTVIENETAAEKVGSSRRRQLRRFAVSVACRSRYLRCGVASQIWMGLRALGLDCEMAAIEAVAVGREGHRGKGSRGE